jgi:hypothetical protein
VLAQKALASIKGKVRQLTRRARHRTLAELLRRLNPVLRGWCSCFRHGVSKRTFGYADHFAFWRVVGWLRKRHLGLNMHTLVRRHLPGWEISDGGSTCSGRTGSPSSATGTAARRSRRHGRAGRQDHPTSDMSTWRAGCVEVARPVRRAGRRNPPIERRQGAPVRPYTCIPTWAGFLYLAIVLDVFSRRVVGWAMEGHLCTELVLQALQMPIARRLTSVCSSGSRAGRTRKPQRPTAFPAPARRAVSSQSRHAATGSERTRIQPWIWRV